MTNAESKARRFFANAPKIIITDCGEQGIVRPTGQVEVVDGIVSVEVFYDGEADFPFFAALSTLSLPV